MKRLINACAVMLLVLLQLQGFWGHVQPVTAADNTATVLDDSAARVTVTPTVVDDRIDWQIDFDRHDPTDHTTRAIRIRVAQAENGSGTVVRRDGDLERSTDPDDEWYHEAEYSVAAQGQLVVSTDLDATQLVVWVQLDGKDMGGTVTSDLLQDEAAQPHTVALPASLQEAVVAAKEAAAAKEAPDIDTTTDVSAPELPVAVPAEAAPTTEEEPAEGSPATDTPATATDKAEEDVPAATTKIEAPGNSILHATNLRLLGNATANLQVDVNDAGIGASITPKGSSAGAGEYNNAGAMQTNRYKEYAVAGSTAVVSSSRHSNNVGNVNLTLEYDYVGTVLDGNGQVVDIGAYVKIDNVVTHGNDWGGVNQFAFDFSHNFYSGLVLANVRSFDWTVTFFVKGDKNTRVSFGDDGGLTNQAQLTFTSLNPGEFVEPLSGGFGEAEYDSTHISHLQFYGNTRVGVAKGNFATEYENTKSGGEQTMGYTSHTWGEWGKTAYDPNNADHEWEDWAGAATFYKGAVALDITGDTFTFKRGTYGASYNAWLALSSGSREHVIPDHLENRKSVSTQKLDGGGSPDQVNLDDDATWTNNDLDEGLVNQYHPNGTFYYYINQQTYSLTDYLTKPEKITISDLLPEHLVLTGGNEQVTLFSDFITVDSSTGINLNDQNVHTSMVNGRQQVTITMTNGDYVRDIAFTGGYFTIRLAVKVTTNPTDVDPRAKLDNQATVTMMPVAGQGEYSRQTNEVTVYLGDKVNGKIRFNKVDGDGQPLAQAGFTLYRDGQPVGAEVFADKDGQVVFADVAPGKYTIKETTPPAGFAPNTTIYQVQVQNDGSVAWTGGMPTNTQVVNHLKPFVLTLLKRNGENKEPLAGAQFVLTDAQGNQLDEQTSGRDGKLTFARKLTTGTYFINETQAPIGFESLTRRIKLVVTATGITATYVDATGDPITGDQVALDYQLMPDKQDNTAHITVDNTPVTPHPGKLPDTGSRGLWGYMLGGLLLVMIGSAWALVQRRRGGDGHD